VFSLCPEMSHNVSPGTAVCSWSAGALSVPGAESADAHNRAAALKPLEHAHRPRAGSCDPLRLTTAVMHRGGPHP